MESPGVGLHVSGRFPFRRADCIKVGYGIHKFIDSIKYSIVAKRVSIKANETYGTYKSFNNLSVQKRVYKC
ncbi:Protein of unknown function [Gryllus bimaculatus]|nr:Protein of unknown function [Gryllus bimaculatus]